MAAEFLAIVARTCSGHDATFDAGQTIFRQGDPVRWLNLVSAGRIRLSRVLARGSEIALATATAGDILAEASVYSPRYHCDAIAETRSSVTRYAMRAVQDVLQAEPLAAKMYGAHLAAQLMDLRAMAEIRAIRRADSRLFAWLQMRATGAPPVFDGEGAWPSIARQLGLAGESVYRALAELKRSGKIKRHRGRVELTRPARASR